jgi:hypothetical protein
MLNRLLWWDLVVVESWCRPLFMERFKCCMGWIVF